MTTLDWRADGQRLATGCYDGVARVWDLDGRALLELRYHTGTYSCYAPFRRPFLNESGAIFSLRWSKNSTYLASASVDGTTIVWDAAVGPPTGFLSCVCP